MDIGSALDVIKSGMEKELIESKHFIEQCRDRDLDVNEIQKIIKEREILGVLEQGKRLYKIWLSYEQRKDLNIILRILPNKKLRLVTIFPCNSERRKR